MATERGWQVEDSIITAVIPTYNRHRSLGNTLDSLVGQTMAGDDYKILIVDNSPDPEPGRQFERAHCGIDNLRYVYQDVPGLSRARNRAIRECRSRYIAFIDDDATADERWLEGLCELFEAAADVGVAGGRVLPVWETPRPSWLDETLLGFVTIVDWGGGVMELDDWKWLAGTNVAYRMTAVRGIEGFREDLGRIGVVRMANDELEFTHRLRAGGWRVMYSPDVVVTHRIPGKRLEREWIRRRNMWQGLSEAVLKGEKFDDQQAWTELATSCAALGIDPKSFEAIFAVTDDPERYRTQCTAIRALTHILYRGGN